MLPLTRDRSRSRFFLTGASAPPPPSGINVLDSAGIVFAVPLAILDSGGTGYTVTDSVLSSDGTSYTV